MKTALIRLRKEVEDTDPNHPEIQTALVNDLSEL